ncbi:MAG: glycosyltransferase [Bacteroidales bacterium]|nr:glycosyltransferase [Bacteroidales bacterium]
MRRVLIISYYWPPTGGSGVQRWVKFCKHLPSLGWQSVVYTPENPEQLAVDESLLKDIPESVEVIRTPIREPYEVYRKLSGAKGGKQSEVTPLNSGRKSWKKKLAVWVRGNLFIPDPRVSWVRPSVKYLRKYLEDNPVDVIITTGPPQSMHLIGRKLMRSIRKSAPQTKWVADFRDPWTEMFYFKHLGLWPLAKCIHRRMEQSVLDEADAVISVTPLVRKDFELKTKTPVWLITNGFDEDDFKVAERGCARSDRFTIVHTGLFAADGNPIALWTALRRLCDADDAFAEKLEIRLAGKVDREITDAIEAAGLADRLTNLGYLPHDGTVVEQRSASALILPLRQEPEYRKVLPGKIFEYLAARRPVLGIGQEDGAAANVLESTRSGVMFDWNESGRMEEFLLARWDEFRSGGEKQIDSDISAYSRRALTESLVSKLETLFQ